MQITTCKNIIICDLTTPDHDLNKIVNNFKHKESGILYQIYMYNKVNKLVLSFFAHIINQSMQIAKKVT